MIENLTKENKLLNDNFFARQEIINESDRLITATVEPDNLDQMIDIIEPLDPEEFSAWRGRLLFSIDKIITLHIFFLQRHIDKK